MSHVNDEPTDAVHGHKLSSPEEPTLRKGGYTPSRGAVGRGENAKDRRLQKVPPDPKTRANCKATAPTLSGLTRPFFLLSC